MHYGYSIVLLEGQSAQFTDSSLVSGATNATSSIRIESPPHTNRVHARARAVYNALDLLPAETRSSHCFDEDLDTQIGHHTLTIETWLANTEPLVQQGLAEAAQAIATGHLDIWDCFLPQAPSQPD
jgi:hypothetical protein